MGKVFGLLLICLGIWVGSEIYFQGTQNAFGGVFASLSGDASDDTRSTPQRAGDRARSARQEQQDRMERVLPE
jgi:hypothetical protein